MDYTHKISNLGDGYPSNGEIIVDNQTMHSIITEVFTNSAT